MYNLQWGTIIKIELGVKKHIYLQVIWAQALPTHINSTLVFLRDFFHCHVNMQIVFVAAQKNYVVRMLQNRR